MKNQKKCAILIATYNGEKYILKQIISILEQQNVDITIFVSDDISNDSTVDIIKLLDKKNITLLPSNKRMGSASQNFFRLIKDVDFIDYDYIAFADQDDIWYPNKLSRAIKAIEEKKLGGYSSNVIAFWKDGNRHLIEKSDPQKKYDFLFASPGPGCTQVFTKKFMLEFKEALLKNDDLSKSIELHDWIVYAYARANQYKWWIDPNPTMDYRQHESNEFGANSGFKTFFDRWKKARDGWYGKQIITIAKFCGLEDIQPIRYLTSGSYFDKLRLAFMSNQLRRKKSEAMILSIMLIVPGFKI